MFLSIMAKYEEKSLQKYYDSERKIIWMPEDDFDLNPNGIGYLLFEKMTENLNKIAQIDALTSETETFSSLLQRSVRTAIHMQNLGIKAGDIVTICSENNMNHHVPYIAAFFIGAITACLDPTLSEEDTVYLMNIVKPKIVFVSKTAEKLIENACSSINEDILICVFGKSKYLDFDEFIEKKIGEEEFEVYKCEDVEATAVILFSSGTTGMPKGICLSNKSLMYTGLTLPFPIGAIFTTLYWASSNYNSLSHLLFGETNVICRNYDPKRILQQIETYKIQSLILAVTDVLMFLRNYPKGHKTSLKRLVTGGSFMSKETLKKLIQTLPTTQIYFGYGQSELFAIFTPTFKQDKIGSVGTPLRGKSYKIVDIDTGESLSFYQKGELLVKSQWCMNGYYQQNANAWDEEGFLRTGDVAYYDEDFCFYIVDRLKEMFKYKSWHIVPAKLERILLQHTDVELGVIVGIPHPEDDNHVLAIVQMTKGSNASPEDVQKFANDRLDERNHIRAGVRFLNPIPLSATGKFKRRELRDMFLRGEF